ncbi:uncharacterized protein BCR38DRAFT_369865 [Pseudomassariella vexata]|uniref:Acetoacetate decarboxylase n=1 Tax=Pseudomassariella vexata TaxID=1141098 RepID=A0A1Y2DYC3_9PEZI|nr:uncharacterized protein BCR38DRAFT_369865 [Pseudomassariella vexata]ORY64302.1 hypothetical protein BCR38DRAFT_369865 [Pseudomassariella vexata]
MKVYGLASLAALVGYAASQEYINNSTEPVVHEEAPWTLHGTVYSITLVLPPTDLPTKAYSPLERADVNATAGDYLGLLGMIQIIRYTDSPVGPYDELLIVPGYFSYPRERDGGILDEETKVRVSRIYVSQKYTCWNGRMNWNIPKHLAKFDWTEKDGKTTVKVYPYDTTGNSEEAYPAELPFFQTTWKAQLLDNIPFSTELYKWIGINATLAQPPLPAGNGSYGELPGTNHWAATVPGQATDHATLGVFDMDQGAGDAVADDVNAVGDEYYENFWPGLLRFNLGIKLDNATITFSAPEIWG